jgi:murein endopeptidase
MTFAALTVLHLLGIAIPSPAAPSARTADAPDEPAAIATAPANTDEDEGEGNVDDSDAPEEAESHSSQPGDAPPDSPYRYSHDLSDKGLEQRWQDDVETIGSISVGFADQGRIINAVHMGKNEAWTCVRPDLAWGVRETIEGLEAAFVSVHQKFPDSAPARLNHIGREEGGWLRPHRSHQSGRDADIGFFYKNDVVPHGRIRRENLIDPRRNWQLVRALVTQSDVQVILVDHGIQRVLRKYALDIGEDPTWVDALFAGGRSALIQHARRHRDHFHVRFFAPRSQELGRRIQPLLARRPDQNLIVHKVKNGQTLGHIARLYKTTVAAILKANKSRRTFVRVGQRVVVPLRGPCTKCPMMPAVVVPSRRLPPARMDTTTAAMTRRSG